MSHRYVSFADSRRRSVSFTKTLGDVRAANRSREQLTKRSTAFLLVLLWLQVSGCVEVRYTAWIPEEQHTCHHQT